MAIIVVMLFPLFARADKGLPNALDITHQSSITLATDTILNHPDQTAVLPPDSIAAAYDPLLQQVKDNRVWWRLMLTNKWDSKDTTIVYPKFIGFCVKVYNWADKFFNSYDSDYVQGTGRRWKVYLKNDNWLDSYAMNFNDKMPMRMMSDVTANLGPYIQFMAVSVGYQFDMSNLIGGQPTNRKRLDLGFTCARLSVDAFYWKNTGGNVIRTFGKFNNGHLIHVPITGVEITSLGVDLCYFFNNRRYSQTAAYGYGKIQKKSAGSFIAGFSYGRLNTSLDFYTLPAVLIPYLTIPQRVYKYHYNNYCVTFGYGHNFVLGKGFLFNITALPGIGLNHCFEDSVDGAGNLFSLGIKGRIALVYNHKDLFCGLTAKMDGQWYRSSDYSFFNATEIFSACVGWRF